MDADRCVSSPCCARHLSLDTILREYSDIGFRKFEVFLKGGYESGFDYTGDPEEYRAAGRKYDMEFYSMHLPRITADNFEESLAESVKCAEFAEKIGAKFMLFKASDLPTFIKAGRPFLDAVDHLSITPVLQNHFGTPANSLKDIKEILEGINDPRLKSLLEVGQYHSAGINWKEAAEYLGDSVVFIHIKDQIGAQSVPFGTGEVDLHGLFEYMDGRGYDGCYVVEMEVKDRENTMKYLREAFQFMLEYERSAS